MKVFSRSVVVALLGAVFAAPLVAQGLAAVPGNSQERPAGCHEDGRQSPAPTPTSHQCCKSGHDFAIVQQRVIEQRAVRVVSPVIFARSAQLQAPSCAFPNPAIVPGDPPTASPLRV